MPARKPTDIFPPSGDRWTAGLLDTHRRSAMSALRRLETSPLRKLRPFPDSVANASNHQSGNSRSRGIRRLWHQERKLCVTYRRTFPPPEPRGGGRDAASQGRSASEAADELSMRKNTVRTHIRHVFGKDWRRAAQRPGAAPHAGAGRARALAGLPKL